MGDVVERLHGPIVEVVVLRSTVMPPLDDRNDASPADSIGIPIQAQTTNVSVPPWVTTTWCAQSRARICATAR